jgi:cell division protein FtsB
MTMSEMLVAWYVVPLEVWDVPTVYRLYEGRKLQYVGQSMVGMSRVMYQFKQFRDVDRAVCLCFPTADRSQLMYIENGLIGYLRPPLNKTVPHTREESAEALRFTFRTKAFRHFRYTIQRDFSLIMRLYSKEQLTRVISDRLEDGNHQVRVLDRKVKRLETQISNLETERSALESHNKNLEYLASDLGQQVFMQRQEAKQRTAFIEKAPFNWYIPPEPAA